MTSGVTHIQHLAAPSLWANETVSEELFAMADLIAHLLRRAGFDTTPDEYTYYAKLGFAGTVEELVNYDSVPDDFATQHTNDIYARRDLNAIQMLWLNRMLTTKRPLQEKMTLFWHGLFATAQSKVNQAELMWQQNEFFRKNALGNFRTILTGVSKDPAMIRWLDSDQNRKGKPNENYAREVMELFTLGIGNYTEQDIKEAARALTGWQITKDMTATFNRGQHDDGDKTFLGYRGPFMLDDIVNIILKQPAHATYMSKRLFTFFVNENPQKATIDRLAATYVKSAFDVKTLVREILLSPEFQSNQSYRTKIKSPVELTIGTFKKLGVEQVPNGTPLALRRMGQEPFNPPSVKGWDGGPAWISTGTMLDRFNFTNLVVRGRNPATNRWLSPITEMASQGPVTAATIIDYFSKNIMHGDVSPDVTQVLTGYLQPGDAKAPIQMTPDFVDTKLRAVAHLLLTTPLHQLN